MCVRDGHVLTVVGAEDVLDVRLVGGVDIHIVLARTRHIEVAIALFGVHTEVELWVFSQRIFAIVRVLEVEIALDDVFVGSWLSNVSSILVASARADFDALRDVARVHWDVGS